MFPDDRRPAKPGGRTGWYYPYWIVPGVPDGPAEIPLAFARTLVIRPPFTDFAFLALRSFIPRLDLVVFFLLIVATPGVGVRG